MHLIRLASHPEFKLKGSEPDLTRYMVLSQEGQTLGEVSDLIADTNAMAVRYLVVTLCHPEGERKIVPLTALRLDENAATATCIEADCTEPNLARFPTDTGGEIPKDLYRHRVGTFIPGASSPVADFTTAEPIIPRTYAISHRMKHLDEAAEAMVDSARAHAEEEHARGVRHPGEEAA